MSDFNPYLSKAEFIKLWDQVGLNKALGLEPNPLELFTMQIIKDTIQSDPCVLEWVNASFKEGVK
jgi:hypothetical protein